MLSIAYFLWIVPLYWSGISKRNIARQITIFRSKWQALIVPWEFITTAYEVVVKISKREVRMNFSWFEVLHINCTAPAAIFTTLIIDSTLQVHYYLIAFRVSKNFGWNTFSGLMRQFCVKQFQILSTHIQFAGHPI